MGDTATGVVVFQAIGNQQTGLVCRLLATWPIDRRPVAMRALQAVGSGLYTLSPSLILWPELPSNTALRYVHVSEECVFMFEGLACVQPITSSATDVPRSSFFRMQHCCGRIAKHRVARLWSWRHDYLRGVSWF